MTTRVSGAEVKAIMATDLSTTEIEPFITPANLIVTDKLGSSSLSDELLKEIEKWFSAHLVSCLSRGVAREKLGEAEITYDQVRPGEGLASTLYGKQVMLLDTTGKLADLGKKKAYLETVNADS